MNFGIRVVSVRIKSPESKQVSIWQRRGCPAGVAEEFRRHAAAELSSYGILIILLSCSRARWAFRGLLLKLRLGRGFLEPGGRVLWDCTVFADSVHRQLRGPRFLNPANSR